MINSAKDRNYDGRAKGLKTQLQGEEAKYLTTNRPTEANNIINCCPLWN